jgi:hypothetical protein
MVFISAMNCDILTLKEDSASVPTWLPCQHHAAKLDIELSDFQFVGPNFLPLSLLRLPSSKRNENVTQKLHLLYSVIFKELYQNKSKIEKLKE